MRRLLPLTLWLICACGTATESTPEPGPAVERDPRGDNGGVDDPPTDVVQAARSDLRLKRWRQLQLDLEAGLQLTADEVCRETGLYTCAELHVVPLGGVSVPNGLFRPIDEPGATAGLASERMVMQACFNRLQLDRAADAPVVFTEIDLAGAEASDDQLDAQSTGLARRLLQRDPGAVELDGLRALHPGILADGGANADWALMACFALGTSTEALTY